MEQTSLKAAIEDYKSSLNIFAQDIFKAAKSFENDYGSGFTLHRNPALGLVEQPIARFDISNQFDIRTSAFTLNSSYIVNQAKSIRNNTTLYNVLCEHSWTEANKLICQQTNNYHRQVKGQDYCYSNDYMRQMGNSLHSADYYKVQVGASQRSGAPLNGAFGRYEVTAKDSINLESVEAHFMCRTKKSASFKAQDFFVNAAGGFVVNSKSTGTINTVGTLNLTAKAAALLGSSGLTVVSGGAGVTVKGPFVHINPGVAGVKLPVDLDLVEKVTSAGFSPTLSGLIGVASNVLAGGSVNLGQLANVGLGSLGVTSSLSKVVTSGIEGVVTGNYQQVFGSAVGAVSGEATGFISEQLAGAGLPTDIAGPLAEGFASMGISSLAGGLEGIKGAALSTATQLLKNGLSQLLGKAIDKGDGSGAPPPPSKNALPAYPTVKPVEKVAEQVPGLPSWIGVNNTGATA